MRAAEVRVLGPVDVVAADGTVALPAKHARLLAALVVANGRTLGVDELVDAVWGDGAPASARKLVQVYISQLRKALPPEVAIATKSGGYVVAIEPELLDAARFERLLDESVGARRASNAALALSLAERALALWRGRAYGELAYEDFARAESERLEEHRLAAVEERLAALLDLGRHEEALADALTHADEQPFRERAQELALLALYRSGRQTDALERYGALRARLSHELGLEPGPALRELQRRVLQQDPALDVPPAATERSGALPLPPNALVGRERELDELCELLDRRHSRLVVLTGAGGSGKTRLALEAANRAAPSFANGVVLVELGPLRDPGLVLPTIARAVEVADEADRDLVGGIAHALLAKELLLVVDNAEHVREAAPGLAELVARAPRLTMLVTSRAVLHVSGEQVFPVAPLGTDDAVELFAQRARLLEPSFEVTNASEADVHEICRRVDGLPLAVELAAGRIRTLTPRALRQRLNDRLSVLTGGPRDLPARQQTLRETIDWSVGLLGDQQRNVLARLAVFPGGASLEAAEVVCGADLDALGVLVDLHLVRREDTGGEPRFGMLETVREYALELLGTQRQCVELALADYFAGIADALRRRAGAEREERRIIEQLMPEIDNVRVALAAAAASHEGDLELRLAGGLYRYWAYRGPIAEGAKWIERALASDTGSPSAARAFALQGAAGLAWLRGDLGRAKKLAESAVATASEVGSTWDEGAAHTVLGIVATADRDYETARYHHLRSLALSEELGFEPVVQKVNLGVVARENGDHEEAIALFEEVVAWHRERQNLAKMAVALLNLGLVHRELGEHGASRREFEEARMCLERTGLRASHAHALQGLAAAEATAGRFESAARLLGEARRELDEVGSPEHVFAPEMVAETKASALQALGKEPFEAAYAGSDAVLLAT